MSLDAAVDFDFVPVDVPRNASRTFERPGIDSTDVGALPAADAGELLFGTEGCPVAGLFFSGCNSSPRSIGGSAI